MASTFFGGKSSGINFVDVDSSGNVYIVSKVHSSGLATSGSYNPTITGNTDFLISKFSPDLSTLIASTYLTDNDDYNNFPQGITIDNSGDVVILFNGNPQNIPLSLEKGYNSQLQLFIAKFSPDLSTLKGAAVIGGSSADAARGITTDHQGNIIVVGTSQSDNFPTTTNAYDSTFEGLTEIVIAKFSPDLSTLIASTYLGGTDYEGVGDVVTTSEGNIILVGQSRSVDFPTTTNAYDLSFSGGDGDFIISIFSPDLSTLISSTYLGGGGNDFGDAVVIDDSGNIIISGRGVRSDLPTTQNAYQTTSQFSQSGYIAKFSPDLSTLISSTYIGGTKYAGATSISLDDANNVYVAGSTEGGDYPTTSDAYQSTFMGGQWDGMVSTLSPDLTTLISSTLIGGSRTDEISDIALDSSGNIIASGLAQSYDYPSTTGAYQIFPILESEIMTTISKFSPDLTFSGSTNHIPTLESQDDFTDEDRSIVISLVGNDRDGDQLTFSIIDQPTNGQLTGTTPNFTFTPDANFNGQDSFTFSANDGTSNSLPQTFLIDINPIDDAPTVENLSITVQEDTPTTIVFLASDNDDDELIFELTSPPENGSVRWSGNNLVYTPDNGFNGQDSLSFKAIESYPPRLESTIGTVSIIVTAENDTPTATSQSFSLNENGSLDILLTGNDVDGNLLTFSVVDEPTNGQLVRTVPNVSYIPNENYVGSDSFTFKANDGLLDSDIATISLTINQVDDVSSTDSEIVVCGTGTYLVDGACKPRPDQTDTTSSMTLTSSTPKLVNTNNEYVSSPQVGNTLFINTEIENLGSNTEDFVASYRYLASSVGDWSEWTWVSSSINAGKTSDVAIPWNPTVSDNYEFDIQIWDNISDKTIITTEKLIVSVKTTTDELTEPSSTTTSVPTTTETKPRPIFVDETKDPQSYVDRYNKEVEYKAWFDENYPDYTIHEAVGLPEPPKEKVPTWVKNNASWWAEGNIEDDTFVSGIQYLMKEKIVDIPDLPEQASEKARPNFVDETKDPQSYVDRYNNEPDYKEWFDENYPDYTIEEAVGVTTPIPGWIKNTASWWSEGLISEDEFVKGIEFLVEKRILNVN